MQSAIYTMAYIKTIKRKNLTDAIMLIFQICLWLWRFVLTSFDIVVLVFPRLQVLIWTFLCVWVCVSVHVPFNLSLY